MWWMTTKKRIVVDVTPDQHAQLAAIAKLAGLTLSNYMRRKLDLPADQQGKRKDLVKK
jgi:uncharacterized protein (DUF1778 family)